MISTTRYLTGWSGGTLKPYSSAGEAAARAHDLLAKIDGPYRIKRVGEDYGRERTLGEVTVRIRGALEAGELGMRLLVAGEPDRKLAARKVWRTLGPTVVRVAASQLGVPYVWADEDPAGGGSSGFDCSGLVRWVYAQADVEFMHLADGIYRDPQVEPTSSPRPGELVFYCYGRLGPGRADHIAIAAGDHEQIAASSAADRVVRQRIDFGNVLGYGYVPGITRRVR